MTNCKGRPPLQASNLKTLNEFQSQALSKMLAISGAVSLAAAAAGGSIEDFVPRVVTALNGGFWRAVQLPSSENGLDSIVLLELLKEIRTEVWSLVSCPRGLFV